MKTNEIQLVVFQLSTEEYGVPITQIEEIIRIPEITRIPNMPNFIEGLVNLRGRIIPIVDLRRRFKLEEKSRNEENRIIIGRIEEQSVGLIVDSVAEVLRASREMIEPIPPTISYIDTQYLNGVVKLENRLVILLDLHKILTELEKETLKQTRITADK